MTDDDAPSEPTPEPPSSPEPPVVTKGPSRRRFLRLGVGGGAVLGLGGLFAWHVTGYEVPDDVARSLVALSPKELLVLEAVAMRMLRADGPGWPDPREVGVGLRMDRAIARLDEASRTDLIGLIHLLEHALPLSVGKASRFTRLSGEDQDEVLASMESNGVLLLRGAFDGLKSLCALAYFSDERTWDPIGYDGPMVARPVEGWVEAARLGRLPRERGRR